MRLLVDMNLTPRWVGYFNAEGHQSVHWSSVGSVTAKDREICDYARMYGFILLTNDLDFPQILAHARASGPSIVLLRGEPLTPEERGIPLLRALDDCAEQLAAGSILTLDWTDRPRARLLPLT